MASFELALPTLLKHEGGFVNHPSDPGGATNYGVSLYWLKSLPDSDRNGFLDGDLNHDGRVDIEDIKQLTPETAGKFYREKWWDFYGFGELANQMIATKVMDTAINIGGKPAIKLLQQCVNLLGGSLAVDGCMGPNTILGANAADPQQLLTYYRLFQKDYYKAIIARKPKMAVFQNGWFNRAAS